MVYDEDDSVTFIKNYLPQEMKDKFSNDDINYVVDLIYDFYESKGYLDDDADENKVVDIDEDEMVAFVSAAAKKDNKRKFTKEEIGFIVDGEMEYCESIHLFDWCSPIITMTIF